MMKARERYVPYDVIVNKPGFERIYMDLGKSRLSTDLTSPSIQRWHNVDSMLIQRLDVESTLNRRCFNSLCLLGHLESGSNFIMNPWYMIIKDRYSKLKCSRMETIHILH